jgi:hypothetical protein
LSGDRRRSSVFGALEAPEADARRRAADYRAEREWALIMRTIKCLKGIRRMPWRWEAMKDVLRCDKPWGAAKKLW